MHDPNPVAPDELDDDEAAEVVLVVELDVAARDPPVPLVVLLVVAGKPPVPPVVVLVVGGKPPVPLAASPPPLLLGPLTVPEVTGPPEVAVAPPVLAAPVPVTAPGT
jgi:hypothetical protein